MSSIELKIKTKHLAAEARIIKLEEEKLKRRIKHSLEKRDQLINKLCSIQNHRKGALKPEARATHLAHCFLKGTPYTAAEGDTTKTYPDRSRIESMVKRYSTEDSRKSLQRLAEWFEAA